MKNQYRNKKSGYRPTVPTLLLLGLMLFPRPALQAADGTGGDAAGASVAGQAVEREEFHAYARERLGALAGRHEEISSLLADGAGRPGADRLGAESPGDAAYAARLRELEGQRETLAAKLEALETRSGDSWREERRRMMELLSTLETHYTALEKALADHRETAE